MTSTSVIVLTIASHLAAPEGPAPSVPAAPTAASLPDCRLAKPKETCRIQLERDAPLGGSQVTVRNGTEVHFLLSGKDPFETCRIESKRTELPQGNAVPDLLSLVGAAGGGLVLYPKAQPGAAPAGEPEPGPLELRVRDLLNVAIQMAGEQVRKLDSIAAEYKAEGIALEKFFGIRYRRSGGNQLPSPREFQAERNARFDRVTAILNKMPSADNPIPSIGPLDDFYTAAGLLFRQYEASAERSVTSTQGLGLLMQEARGNIDLVREGADRFRAGRAALADIKLYLEQLEKATWEFTARLTPDKNARLVGTVSCSRTRGDKVSLDPVAWALTFQDPPRLSLSTGFLGSVLPKEKAFVGAVPTGRTDAKVVVPMSVIQKTSTAPQVLPMTLIQIRLNDGWNWKGRTLTVNLTPAIGINLNNKEAEFFGDISLGISNLYISAGWHIGHTEEPGGGFVVGDRPTLPVPILPVERPWTPRLAFALSYRVPLK